MSRISYIASSGGLLGLCMGFSFVSLAEIAYHCFLCIVLLFRRKRALFKKAQIHKKHMKNKQKSHMRNGSRSSLSCNISPTFSSLPPPPPPPASIPMCATAPPMPVVASAPPFPSAMGAPPASSSVALPNHNGGRPGWGRASARPNSNLALKTILWWRPRGGGRIPPLAEDDDIQDGLEIGFCYTFYF